MLEVNRLSSILDIINVPIGWLFKWLYMLVNDYGLAIILIAVITKLLLLPLGIKQQKGTLSQLKFKPRINEIQAKYRDNPERMQREMNKLKEEGYSPTAGCSSLLIQFPILIGIYNVIRHPLSYIVGISSELKDTLLLTLQKFDSATFANMNLKSTDFEIKALSYIQNNASSFKDIIPANTLNFIENFKVNFLGMPQFNLSLVPEKWKNFIGILPIPSFKTWLVIIPLLSGITALILSLVSQKTGVQNYMQDENEPQQGKGMMLFMTFLTPYMSYAIAMSVPAGLGLYWICSNLLMLIQTVAINKIYSPEKYVAQMKAEEAARKEKRKKAQQRIAEEKRAEKLQASNKPVKDKEDIPGEED